MRRLLFGSSRLALGAFVVLLSCSSDPEPTRTGTTSSFVIPASLDELSETTFFDQPYPSDLRRESDGTVRLKGWPNPFQNPLLKAYIEATDHLLDGFSPAATVYLRFTQPIDPGTLPADPPASVDSNASVQMIDVDPASPEFGKRRLVQIHWREDEGTYWAPNTLAVMPVFGRPLRPKTKYAVVVTNKVRAKDGGLVRPSSELEEVLELKGASERTKKAKELFRPALGAIATAGIPVKDIVHLTVFTTNDPTAETFALADDVQTAVPPPTAKDWTTKEETADYDVYEGSYGPSPNYQSGTTPYAQVADGGSFVFENGKPKLQGTFDLRFALVVPNADKCPVPAGGYPIVLYEHGTGGDYRSFVRDGTASSLAKKCLASMGVDQIFHGTRPGSPPEDDPQRDSKIQFLFFNFNNPKAARSNNRQSAIDVVQRARLFTDSKMKVPANVAKTQQAIGFDDGKILFFGHSQGGLNGPLFLAASKAARGGVLSGAGSVLTIALLEKTKPVDVAAFVRNLLLGLSDPERAKEVNEFHPAFTLAQTIVDALDPVHYGAFITTSPRPGFASKSIFQTEGIAADGSGDTYAPPHGIEALAVAMSLPRISPGVRPVKEATWAGLGDISVSGDGVRGNIAGGQATGALAQFTPKTGRDGHFVVFDIPEARSQAASFCAALAADPIGKLSLP
jgi:hypothetical protein